MDGFLGLHFAAQQGHLEVVRALLRHISARGEHGAVKKYVNRVVRKGKTALELCKSEALRAELRGASLEEAEGGEAPAKRSRCRAEELPAAANHAAGLVLTPARQSPAEGPAPELAQRLLVRGPLALEHIEVAAAEGERHFPAGISALADVHWAAAVAERPELREGPVWCLSGHEVGTPNLRVTLQRSSYKLLVYTHFSDEVDILPKDKRCNACVMTVLLETADGLLVLYKAREGQLWQSLPPSCVVGSPDLREMLCSALREAGQGLGDVSAAVDTARLLALVDVGEDAPDGHRHEFFFTLRLAVKAEEVQRSCAAGREPLFVRPPAAVGPAQGAKDECTLCVGFDAVLGGNFTLAKSTWRALQLFRDLAQGEPCR